MNSIQKAFEMQEIYIAWAGTEPANSMVITDTYLNNSIDGYPRYVRTSEDTGIGYDLDQLKTDYDSIHGLAVEDERIATIKQTASDLIYSYYSDVKQRNLTARGLELIHSKMADPLHPEEVTELDEIQATWDWIKDVRNTSNVAESNGTLPHLINWPNHS